MCNHDPKDGELETCDTAHECAECKERFQGTVREGCCLNCFPVRLAERDAVLNLIKKRRARFDGREGVGPETIRMVSDALIATIRSGAHRQASKKRSLANG